MQFPLSHSQPSALRIINCALECIRVYYLEIIQKKIWRCGTTPIPPKWRQGNPLPLFTAPGACSSSTFAPSARKYFRPGEWRSTPLRTYFKELVWKSKERSNAVVTDYHEFVSYMSPWLQYTFLLHKWILSLRISGMFQFRHFLCSGKAKEQDSSRLR